MLPAVPSPTPQPWVFDADRTAYTRPVVGSELVADRVSSFADGLGDVCHGIDFTSSLSNSEIRQRARRAFAKLRFHCPIVAATIQGPHDGVLTRRWVYVPMRDESDCEAWLAASFAIHERGPSLNSQEFVDNRLRTHLPINSSGDRTAFQCHLLTDDTSAYGLYFHGTHSILDAWPTLYALEMMLQWMLADTLGTPINLEFGSEHKNLPLDPVSASGGGPREAWDTLGVEVFTEAAQKRSRTTPILALPPPSQSVCTNGPRVRFEHVFPPSETEKIVAASKRNGVSATQMLEAAHCIALAVSNPELALRSDIEFSAESTIASLERELVAQIDKKKHFISAFSFMPVRIPMRDILDADSTRKRVLLTASALKADYARYIANPCFLHLLPAQSALPLPPVTSESAQVPPQISMTMLTNLGRVSARLSNDYVSPSGEHVVHVRDMCFGHRVTTSYVVLHSWTFEDGLHIQLQASDMWASDADRAYLERFFDTMRRLILEQLD